MPKAAERPVGNAARAKASERSGAVPAAGAGEAWAVRGQNRAGFSCSGQYVCLSGSRVCDHRRIEDVRDRASGESSLGGDVWQSIKLNKHKVRQSNLDQFCRFSACPCFELRATSQASLFLPPKDEEEGASAATGASTHGAGEQPDRSSDKPDAAKDDGQVNGDKSKAAVSAAPAPAAGAETNSLAGLLGGYGSPGSDSDSDDSDD